MVYGGWHELSSTKSPRVAHCRYSHAGPDKESQESCITTVQEDGYIHVVVRGPRMFLFVIVLAVLELAVTELIVPESVVSASVMLVLVVVMVGDDRSSEVLGRRNAMQNELHTLYTASREFVYRRKKEGQDVADAALLLAWPIGGKYSHCGIILRKYGHTNYQHD